MPVESMSIRALIGMVQALLTPGNSSAWFMSAINLSMVMPWGQVSSGLRLMTVSNISTGAGSVAVLGQGSLSDIRSTFLEILTILSCALVNVPRLVTDMPGRHDGE